VTPRGQGHDPARPGHAPGRHQPPTFTFRIAVERDLRGETNDQPRRVPASLCSGQGRAGYRGEERQQLTRELAALCALTGARAESVYGQGAGLAGLRVFDPGGELVISGSVDEVLAELVGLPI